MTSTTPDRFRAADCDLGDFRALVERDTAPAEYGLASAVTSGIPVYDGPGLRRRMSTDAVSPDAVRTEWATALAHGPGVIVISSAVLPHIVDRASDAFRTIIEEERRAGIQSGDHYARPGDNDRVWNALEKLALTDPVAFVDYYSNDLMALGALAWLGPGYQVTSQVNVVNPGGAAQMPHRDYHLGFLTDDVAEQYPPHVHRVSPLLTLQGVVAHLDLPAASGTTMILPWSHLYEHGYLAWRRPEFVAYFAEHHAQLDLGKGDLVLLNPAVFHAAGNNRTPDVIRMVNLLQISSAFGRAMESVDRYRISRAVYPVLRQRWEAGDPDGARRALAAAAEGYSFPTNLDRDQPVGRLTPPSAAEILLDGLDRGVDDDTMAAALAEHAARRLTH